MYHTSIIKYIFMNYKIIISKLELSPSSKLKAESFTSLMADLRQDINRVSSFSRCKWNISLKEVLR